MRTLIDDQLVEIRRTDFDLLMQIMAGLAVPYSLNRSLLGVAADPWSKLHGEHGFGYPSAEEYGASFERHAKGLRAQLMEEVGE